MSNELVALVSTYPIVSVWDGRREVDTENECGPPIPVEQIRRDYPVAFHPQLVSVWTSAGEARLNYVAGSRGLTLLSPRESKRSTEEIFGEHSQFAEEDLRITDVAVGRFETELDAIIFDQAAGVFLWANPLDERESWKFCGDSIVDLLRIYRETIMD